MIIDEQVNNAMNQLKDFQRKTVEVAVAKLLNGQKRFLVADEVGLGKTIVAKGIIARLVQANQGTNSMFNVIYICSNQALAKQNLDKLSYVRKTGDDDTDYDNVIDYSLEDDRITALAYEEKVKKNKYGLHIKALTPATSFDNGNLGRADERILLFRILSSFPEFQHRHIALKWFLRGGKSPRNWHREISHVLQYGNNEEYGYRKIRSKIYSAFKRELKLPLDKNKFNKIYKHYEITDETSLWKILLQIIEERKQNRSFFALDKDGNYTGSLLTDFSPMHFKLVAELRFRLSLVCKEFLQADLFVLDEFQRYSNLIQTTNEDDDPGTFIAKAVFSKPDAKVIMLSATPFKAYTTKQEEMGGESHYIEFRKVLEFLLQEKEKDGSFWSELDQENKEFFKLIRHFENSPEIVDKLSKAKNGIEKKYRNCMARTERSLVESSSASEVDKSVIAMQINREDIIDFLSTDEIVKAINKNTGRKLPVPVEYVKSSPFPFSFLQDYEHMKVLQEEYDTNNAVKVAARKAKRAWVPLDRVKEYKALLPERDANKSTEPNAKLRMLYDETVRNKGWQLLWVPPSIPYYNVVKGPYVNAERFSKTLIFSAWKMVPRMVSALVSYEAERLSVGKYLAKHKDSNYRYNDKKRYPYPLLTFKNSDGKLTGMNNLMLAYPSVFLSKVYDPALNVAEKKTLGEIKSEIAGKIKKRLLELNIMSVGSHTGDYQKWEWYGTLFLDKHEADSDLLLWINEGYDRGTSEFDADDEKRENGNGGKESHFEELRKCIMSKDYTPNISRLNTKQLDNLCDRLAEQCLGSPANCIYRSFTKTYHEDKTPKARSAFSVGMAFITLFNKAESIAVVNEFETSNNYHQNVLAYCVAGNIQSMLDEFVYQLKDSSGKDNASSCADFIREVLTVNPGAVEVKSIESLGNAKSNKGFNIRTHYAIPFGLGSASELKNGARQIKVREAFNSPFRPFVLTSTSIGQEGLDFHYYCSKLIHWNLPSNPIDLEQREGRIKRFKGLNIRRIIAEKYANNCIVKSSNIWGELFGIAEAHKPKDKCDLIPFWHLKGNNDQNIKTIIPIYEYSKDFDKLNYIKSVLGNYRLTFGQPRQEELIYTLESLMNEDETKEMLRSLIINLSPISYLGE
ncbi:MAG: DEAD/DEAH box helicase family protein [Bacteroidia bacterium]|nr:DEAD/DEAH box helicase family protein [Bacteroidia bacterium]